MTAKVQEYLTPVQWAAACALKEIEFFKQLPEDLELNVEAWREWINSPTQRRRICQAIGRRRHRLPEAATAASPTHRSCDRGADQLHHRIHGRALHGAATLRHGGHLQRLIISDSSLFVLFPGVDPGDAIEALGKLGFTEVAGNYVSISMGQGQEKNGENVLDRFTREGGWAFLQNVHLMQGWLPMLERKLEIANEIAHEDFRCFVTAEPPGLPAQMLVPEGIMQAAIKVANEPPTDVKSLFRMAYANFDQATLDKSTHPIEHRPMLFALSFFHAIVLGRRKFGKQGLSRPYAWNSGDLLVCGMILHNYLEANDETPWTDVRYLFGEVMYGGHITDPWDRRITSTYLEVLVCPDLVDEKTDFTLAPGLRPLLEGEYADFAQYIEDASPPESPLLFGMRERLHLAA